MVKSQTKSLTDNLVRAVTLAAAAGDTPLKAGRAKGKKKVAEAGPAGEGQQPDESGGGDAQNAGVAALFNNQT